MNLLMLIVKALFLVLALPLIGLIWIWSTVKKWRARVQKEELDALLNIDTDPELTIRRGELVQPMSQAEIEAAEMVHDPMGGAPNLPFGHLNAHWQTFVAEGEPGSSLWFYEARRQPVYGGRELHRGYVWVKLDGTISRPFRCFERTYS